MTDYLLGDLIEIKNGTKYSHLNKGNIPLYGSGGIMGYVDDFLFDGEAILLPRKGSLKNIMYNSGKLWTVDTMYYAIVSETTNPYYLYTYLSVLDLSALDSGSTLPSMTKSAYNTLKVKLPTIKIQNEIAAFLKSIDRKMTQNNLMNQELEAMAKLVYDYWFVQFDFPISREYIESLDGDELLNKPYKTSGCKMVYNVQLNREIPEGWGVELLSDITASINRGISPKYIEKEGIPVVNQKCIRDNTLNYELTRNHDFNKKGTSKLLEKYDILVNSTGVGTLGRTAIVKYLDEEIVTADSHVTIVRADSNLINTEYLSYTVTILEPFIEQLGTGSTGQTELSRKDLGKLKIIIPSSELQNKFQDFISPVWEKQTTISKENRKLSELRDWLKPMLMNGQVTVKEANNKVDNQLDIAAEEVSAYQKNSGFVDSLFEKVNLHKEIAAIQLIEEQITGRTHGKTGIQKTTSNLQQILKEERLKKVKFEEKPWGMFSETIANNIETNPFIYKYKLEDGKKVYRVKPDVKKELQNWINLNENRSYITSLNQIISIHQEPFINNDIYKMELLNTVYRCMSKLESDELGIIREAMKDWPMIEPKYKNKAEKFSEKVTAKMMDFIKKNQLI